MLAAGETPQERIAHIIAAQRPGCDNRRASIMCTAGVGGDDCICVGVGNGSDCLSALTV